MSSDTTNRSLGDPFPYRWLILAVTVTVAMFALLTWHVYNTYRVGQLVSIDYVRSENLRDLIVELSGVIQSSARRALGTSDARAAASYREAVRELSRRIGQTRELMSLEPASNAVSKVEAAHLRLRRLEAEAFARAGEDAGPAAAALLDSDEYRSDSEVFLAAVASFITQVRQELDATFVLRLPTTEGRVTGLAEEDFPAELEASRGRLLLLAEDHPYVRELIVSTLESCGYYVAAAGDGGELLGLFEQHRRDAALAVIDFDLPVCDGGECLRRIRESGSNIPVILITGRVVDAVEDRFAADAIVLAKPFTMADLSRVVSDALKGRGGRHAGG